MTEDQRYICDLIGASAERTVKRLWVIIIILIMALCASNACWIWYESQYEDVVTTQEVTQDVDSDSGDAIINDGVHVTDGTSETNNKDNN